MSQRLSVSFKNLLSIPSMSVAYVLLLSVLILGVSATPPVDDDSSMDFFKPRRMDKLISKYHKLKNFDYFYELSAEENSAFRSFRFIEEGTTIQKKDFEYFAGKLGNRRLDIAAAVLARHGYRLIDVELTPENADQIILEHENLVFYHKKLWYGFNRHRGFFKQADGINWSKSVGSISEMKEILLGMKKAKVFTIVKADHFLRELPEGLRMLYSPRLRGKRSAIHVVNAFRGRKTLHVDTMEYIAEIKEKEDCRRLNICVNASNSTYRLPNRQGGYTWDVLKPALQDLGYYPVETPANLCHEVDRRFDWSLRKCFRDYINKIMPKCSTSLMNIIPRDRTDFHWSGFTLVGGTSVHHDSLHEPQIVDADKIVQRLAHTLMNKGAIYFLMTKKEWENFHLDEENKVKENANMQQSAEPEANSDEVQEMSTSIDGAFTIPQDKKGDKNDDNDLAEVYSPWSIFQEDENGRQLVLVEHDFNEPNEKAHVLFLRNLTDSVSAFQVQIGTKMFEIYREGKSYYQVPPDVSPTSNAKLGWSHLLLLQRPDHQSDSKGERSGRYIIRF